MQPENVIEEESSSSNEEAEERTLCVDDDDASEYDELDDIQPDDMDLSDYNALKPDDFVLTKFATKKTIAMYIGQVQNRIEDTDEVTFEVKFMRREKPKSFTFIFPNVEDISDVLFEDIVGKLPSPIQHGGTARIARHMVFPVDLTSYSDVLR